MVRNCVIDDCRESDLTILTHRFPKSDENTALWRQSLRLNHFSIEDLQKRWVVCTKHFASNAYRNPNSSSLNTNAVPNLLANEDNFERINQRKNRCEPSQPPAKNAKVMIPIDEHNKVVLVKKSTPKFKPEQLRPHLELKKALTSYAKIKPAVISHGNRKQQLTQSILMVEDDDVEFEEEIQIIDDDANNQVQQIVYETEHHPYEEEETEIQAYEEAQVQEYQLVEEEKMSPVETFEIATQTEDRDDAVSTVSTEGDSKDDKLIRILYPEFSGLTKMKLVEVLNEKNQRIQSLEEKIAKLETAMRNLL